jgi:hypothetical protein
LAVVVGCAAACGGGQSSGAAEPTGDGTAQAPDPQTVCEAGFARQLACGDVFLPALVEMRIRNNVPAGITERASTPEGREALMATARTEFAADSQPEAVTAQCHDIIANEIPADRLAAMTDELQACTAQADCAAFTACRVAIIERVTTPPPPAGEPPPPS